MENNIDMAIIKLCDFVEERVMVEGSNEVELASLVNALAALITARTLLA